MNGVIKKSWKSTARYQPYSYKNSYPSKAVLSSVWSMVSKIIDEKHIPKNSTIVTFTSEIIESIPNRSITKVRSYFPENQNSNHVGGPDSDESMNDTSKIERNKFDFFLHLIQHAHCNQKSSNPEENIDSKVRAWS
jgi:hypothetical protein